MWSCDLKVQAACPKNDHQIFSYYSAIYMLMSCSSNSHFDLMPVDIAHYGHMIPGFRWSCDVMPREFAAWLSKSCNICICGYHVFWHMSWHISTQFTLVKPWTLHFSLGGERGRCGETVLVPGHCHLYVLNTLILMAIFSG